MLRWRYRFREPLGAGRKRRNVWVEFCGTRTHLAVYDYYTEYRGRRIWCKQTKVLAEQGYAYVLLRTPEDIAQYLAENGESDESKKS